MKTFSSSCKPQAASRKLVLEVGAGADKEERRKDEDIVLF
jgi:hypothetical protein